MSNTIARFIIVVKPEMSCKGPYLSLVLVVVVVVVVVVVPSPYRSPGRVGCFATLVVTDEYCSCGISGSQLARDLPALCT